MNYTQAKKYLSSFINYENVPGITYASEEYSLQHIEILLHRMGDPHLNSKTVHIAGSKGKGSTAAMISQVLTSAGYKTGLYTSPHLHNLRERIKIDGNQISKKNFTSLISELKQHFDAPQNDTPYKQLTYFEALTVLAFSYFSKMSAEFQVLEVGLGGRLDATNVANPELCVITPIGLEHTQILGNTLSKIAYEKAGIIKPGSSVVVSPQTSEVLKVLSEVCRQRQAKLIEVNKIATWHKVSHDLFRQTIIIQSKTNDYHLQLPLLGSYQLENAATAIVALEALTHLGFAISAHDIKTGFSVVNWPGRFQILKQAPTVVVDGAHNIESIKRLIESLGMYIHYKRLFIIIGLSSDKDISGIAKELAHLLPEILVTQATHPRAASPSAIASSFESYGITPKVTSSVTEALQEALSVASKEDLICITGSLFVVAEALDYAAENFAAMFESPLQK